MYLLSLSVYMGYGLEMNSVKEEYNVLKSLAKCVTT